jgi:two-component system response regulator YesN
VKDECLSVLLVDDEYLIRELLKNRIQWEHMGCQIVGEASCASEVFDFLEEGYVDLIITDINMPMIDGLEMSKKILESYPKIKIIVISGYDRFEYAQNGIQIGIEDYILKPIREAEVEKAVLSVKAKLKKERQNECEKDVLKKQLEKNMPFLKEKFFIELFKKKLSDEEIREKLMFFKLEMEEDFFQVALIEMTFSSLQKYSEENRLMVLLGTLHSVETYFKEYPFIYSVIDTKENLAIFCNNKKVNLMEACESLLKSIKNTHQQWDVTIGIGGIKKELQQVKDSYLEAATALQFKTILGSNQVIYYNDLDIVTGQIDQPLTAHENAMDQLQFLIKAGLREQALAYIDTLYENIGAYINIEQQSFIMHVRIQTSRMIAVLFYMISSMEIKLEDIIGYQEDFFKEIAAITTIPHAKQLVTSVVEHLIKHINSIQTHMVNDYMEDILNYIQENMSDYGLTLNKIAVHFYMNPSYLSRIFKQKKGIAFKDYLNKIRMEQALEYARNTDFKAYEIGEKVGIPDANYFSTSFKKYIGVSMTEYKKMIINEG